mmetsp:Transcript_48386/g.75415  ORF Transcript_48386/g.75415 Transcript_48386/m.75415 type:complete len:85 (+) Transcript_48386:1740-1994(+)
MSQQVVMHSASESASNDNRDARNTDTDLSVVTRVGRIPNAAWRTCSLGKDWTECNNLSISLEIRTQGNRLHCLAVTKQNLEPRS